MGDTQTIRVDTRVIAASNRDLMQEVAENRFREDLYWRLNVVPIHIPALRQRKEDVPLLVAHFLNVYNEANDRYVVHIQREAMEALQDYDWPGNVRELQNYIERALVMADGDELTTDLAASCRHGRANRRGIRGCAGADLESLTYAVVERGLGDAGPNEDNLHAKIVNRVERELIAQVMLSCNHVQTKAAARLGINRNTLHKKAERVQLGERLVARAAQAGLGSP